MTGFLFDTNCISEVVRLKPDPGVMAWIEAVEESSLYLTHYSGA
jgi:predicted nucleic acid-binding protein